MTDAAAPMNDVNAKLDWARRHHDDMLQLFKEFARPGGGDERPYGIKFHEHDRPAGLLVAHFIVEAPMPVEMSLLAADLVHNARVALDHVLARLKEHFGGDVRKGSFPTWSSQELWEKHVASAGNRSPLHGLDQRAVDLVYGEQPLHRPAPEDDALLVLNRLDNVDKHRLLQHAFVYPGVQRGVDLIEIVDRARLRVSENLWTAGRPLHNETALARFLFRGRAKGAVRVRRDAPIGFASGEIGSARVGYMDIIARVQAIADLATALITGDADGPPSRQEPPNR